MPKRRLKVLSLVSTVAFLSAFAGSAIVIRHDRPDAAYRELAADYPFCSLNLGGWGGGCTLIAPRWVVTAAHAVEHLDPAGQIEVGGQSVEVAEVFVHPDFDTRSYRGDLALLRLVGPVRGQKPVALYDGRDEAGGRAVVIGRGHSGTGKTGANTPDKTLRAAENRVEFVSDHWLRFVFDPPPGALELEGISGPGDSGGPAFLETEGGLMLAGVSSWQDNTQQGVEGVYGVKEYYVRVSSYITWIKVTMSARTEDASQSASGSAEECG